MLAYLIKDMLDTLRYLPDLVVAAFAVMLVVLVVNVVRRIRGKEPLPPISSTFFCTYVIAILFITFLSRESGTRQGFDLEIGSTWAINDRNKAYVIENVLLFVPFGFLAALRIPAMRNFFTSIVWGILFSWGIECMQLITQRGYFQLDDILTNGLGTVIGLILYTLAHGILKKKEVS
ncbi:MAG: VanZ family protein [Lachnospiraceae bacterium]|nr:VanZ family protein [Lachnospiraceae bacterium]